MDIDNVFSKETIDSFFSKLTADELKSVTDIYFICDPSKSNVPRKIRIQSEDPLASWDSEWTSVEIPSGEKDPRDFVKDQNERAKKVYEYYEKHLNEFQNVETVDGQKRLAEATGETGGSFLFHCDRDSREIPFRLAKGFIAFATELYHPYTLQGSRLTRISRLMVNYGRKFASNGLSDFDVKVKSNVASYLNWLRPKKGKYVPFESSLKGWDMEIEPLTESMAKVKLGKNENERA